MLKLIKCEFLKLKRKKFIPLIILAAFLFPIPLTYLMTTPSMIERYTDRADAFDGLFNMVLGYGIQFLLPCIIGVIAAILFFMERDNDTFKNLRTIPVTSTQMVLAKIIVLFLFGIIDHGALLEEESLAELEQKSSKHIRFTLSDTAQAARILERNFHENHFSIQDDHNLRLHNLELPVGKIVTAFVENGLEVSEAHTCEESLEDYFKRVTGGEGIA